MPEAAIYLCAVARAVSKTCRICVKHSLRTAAIIFTLLALVTFVSPLTAPAAGGNTKFAPDSNASPSSVSGIVLAAAQENGAQEQAAPRQEQSAQPVSERAAWEKYFRGSFLGSFFLGYPYSGVGTPDIIVMAIAALLALRLAWSKVRGKRRDNYTLPKDKAGRASMQRFDTSWAGRNKEGYRVQTQDDFVEMSEPRPMGSSRSGQRTEAPRDKTNAEVSGLDSHAAASRVANEATAARQPSTVREEAYSKYYPQAEQEAVADVFIGQWASIAAGVDLPPGFDAAYFLEWGRSIYATLQYAWADRQVDALAPYVSRDMFNVLKTQAAKDPNPVQVDIKYVHSRLTDIRHNDNWAQVSIGFTVSMSSGLEGRPVEIRETWRFVCGGDDGAWRVEAIEQA